MVRSIWWALTSSPRQLGDRFVLDRSGRRVAGAAVLGLVLELSLFRRLYRRDHLSQVLATFGLILIANVAGAHDLGAQPLLLNRRTPLSGGRDRRIFYPAYRLVIIVSDLASPGCFTCSSPGAGSACGAPARPAAK